MKLTNRKHATLPEGLEENTLRSMVVGDSAWVVPWAMLVDAGRRCWLRPDYTTHSHAGGTVQMLVKRLEDGYHVWLPNGYNRFTPEGQVNGIPVVELHEDW